MNQHVDGSPHDLWTSAVAGRPPVGNLAATGAPSPAMSHPCGILWIPVGQPNPT
jgi:hypothetical protein